MFTHLHLHSYYSIQDGLSSIKDIVSKVKELGQTSCALTDHGNMFGVVKFYKECKANGIKPIIGSEVYVAERTMHDKTNDDRRSYHLILLAKNMTGYKNLMEIVSDAYTEGFYYKPRTDKEQLKKHSEGLICLSACLAGRVPRLLLDEKYEEAKAEAIEMSNIFEDYYLEVQNHGQEEDKIVIDGIKRISEETGIPMVATNDAHYVNKDDWKAHEAHICIGRGQRLADPSHFTYPTHEFYIKSEDEMRGLLPKEACDNTNKIADLCDFEMEFHNYHIPKFPIPDGFDSEESYFEHLCYEGFNRLYGDNKGLKEKLDFEINTIKEMGYVGYFLIVQDYINYAKANGIPVGPGRGSAAGSIVSYCLGITDLEPTKYDLIFERFLNPERISMPDIDVDFDPTRRKEVIDYVANKYGQEAVCQICTFGTMQAKAAVKDVARIMDMDYRESNALSKMIPEKMSLKEALEYSDELKLKYDHDLITQKVIDMAIKLENVPKSVGTHAAGVVISSEAVKHFIPIMASKDGVATMHDMNEVEEQGVLKMDFLGLRNLTVINDTVKLVKENKGIDIDINNIPLDDADVYNMIAKGKTVGVFQLESKGIRDALKKMKPSCFEDIIAGISLYRPGPMEYIPEYVKNKKNPSKIQYKTEALRPILDVTYGVMVYQEQVMNIVRSLAGYSFGRSDLVRRYMSKKKMDKMLEEKEYFINGKTDENGNVEIKGCVRNGISKKVASEIFDQMTSFAEYAFNKSHAAVYALITYQTAYLKYHYPAEFMAAQMTSAYDDYDKLAVFIDDIKRLKTPDGEKVKLIPPTIEKSKGNFSCDGNSIIYGLDAIRNVGKSVSRDIEAHGNNYEDIYDFFLSLSKESLNKKNIEGLIFAGAVPFYNTNTLLENYENLVKYAKVRNANAGQTSIFDLIGDDIKPEIKKFPNYKKDDLLAMEKDALGVYLSGHPLKKHKSLIDEFVNMTGEELALTTRKDDVVMAGILTAIKTIYTKKGEKMAFLSLEDETSAYEGVIFPKSMMSCDTLLYENNIVALKGEIDESGSLVIQNVVPIEDIEFLSSAKTRSYNILKIRCSRYEADEVENIIRSFKGNIPVLWYDVESGKQFWLRTKARYDGLLQIKARNVIGKDNIKWDII